MSLSYESRVKAITNPVAQRLLHIIHSKQTNLAVAADVTTKAELITLAEQIGPEICMLKTHVDIIKDFDNDMIVQLQALALKHNFLLCEDRKFADIGSTVQEQYSGGVHRIVEWADIVIAHAISGPGIIDALKQASGKKERAVLLIAQLSSEKNLIDDRYTKAVVDMAAGHADFVAGFITQSQCCTDPRFLHLVPGVNLAQVADSLGQQYNTPEHVVRSKKADIIIVGRGIYKAADPVAAARQYRHAAWDAYQSICAE